MIDDVDCIAVSQPMIRSVSPTIGSTITRDQSIHFQFNEPVSLGDGNVVISILDTLSQSILFDEIEGKASDILKQESNAFMITLPFYELPFYPYSIYSIHFIPLFLVCVSCTIFYDLSYESSKHL